MSTMSTRVPCARAGKEYVSNGRLVRWAVGTLYLSVGGDGQLSCRGMDTHVQLGAQGQSKAPQKAMVRLGTPRGTKRGT